MASSWLRPISPSILVPFLLLGGLGCGSDQNGADGANTAVGGAGGDHPPGTASTAGTGAAPGSGSAPGNGGASGTGSSTGSGGSEPRPTASGFLHVEGNQLKDDAGNVARLTGVNWFGFETQNQSPHGLWTRDYRSMLRQIRDLGFNTVRIPWSNRILDADAAASSVNTYGADAYDGCDPMNGDLDGLTPLEILDRIIGAAGDLGLKIILDNHSRKPDGYMEEELWYTDTVSEERWIADWLVLADRYYGNHTVIALDLNNEPHGDATWETGDAATDWAPAAERCGNAILTVNPDVLVIVEGVEKVGGDTYWWGGNLSGVRSAPIDLSNPSKLVYSPHEYGPEVFAQDWFAAASFPGNLAAIWQSHFGFIMDEERGHLLVGEFGIKSRDAAAGAAGIWFDTWLEYMADTYSWTFWCWNPNSGDTEGILGYDWLTPTQWKVDALTPHLAPPIGG
ncbi:MAG: glycoside hydrolase family 5 protein [Polyangiaceae bacterium]|nr:glycoside hydrolase family 5 protein [Polyangiaceae bacterium]